MKWILSLKGKDECTSILNLPNGCLIKYTNVWSTMATETMQFVPDINYIDGEFKQILTQQFHYGI